LYRIQNSVLSLHQQTQQPPATTYRPQTVSFVTQKPAIATTPAYITKPAQSVTFGSGSTRGGAIDFDSEFKKFQQETGFKPVTPAPSQPSKSVKIQPGSGQSSNPIYQTQLVYNPSSGQYDSNLYQAIAQTDGEFQLNQRIQPFVQQYQPQFESPIFRQQQAAPRPQAQVPQQAYQRQQNEQQFVNSQQLFAQQLQMQQSQLQRDRIEASKKVPPPAHRYQLQQAEPSPLLRQGGQQYYYVPQAQQSGGQIEAFLRGHNLDFQ
jgi:hypothetical protein